MVRTCVDPTLDRLSKIEVDGNEAYFQVQAWKRELRFLKMFLISIGWKRKHRFLKKFLSCFVTWDDNSDPEIRVNLRSMHTAIEKIWEGSRDIIWWRLDAGTEAWGRYAWLLDRRIQQSKLPIEKYRRDLLDSSLQSESLTSDESVGFLDSILNNLKDLERCKADEIAPVKMQIGILQDRIKLLVSFFVLIACGCIDSKELRDLKACLQNFACNTACLTFLFWTKKDTNEEIMFASKLNHIIADMHQKIIRPCGPADTALYIVALKSIRLQRSHNTLLLGGVVAGFVDIHLESLAPASEGDFQALRDGLIFILTFLADPPEECEKDNKSYVDIRNDIDVLLVSDFTGQKTLDFVRKIENIIQKIRQQYVHIPDPSSYNFPKTNGLGFFDLFLQNLESLKERLKGDMNLIPIVENTIVKIEKELVSLRPSLSDIFELQKEHKEFEDTWLQVIGLAYQIELFINLCYVDLHPAWYNMACLFYILEKMKIVKSMLEKVYIPRARDDSLPSISMSSERSRYSIIDEEVVGFKEEVEKIIEEFKPDNVPLAIISVVGMGGSGKTTLAKKVYNANSVRQYFHIWAFCSVSQVYNTRKLLLDILSCLDTIDDKIHSMMVDDLAHHLWKCLSGRKYLIVMDDIWDIEAWNKVKSSFPDCKNGSKVIFTTRMAKVAFEANSIIHHLRLLSEKESLMLLQMKAFGKNYSPQCFSEVGEQIVKNCRGLPLAIVLVGGLLARIEQSEKRWNEIAKMTSSYAFEEGCRDIIELSYRHLPEHLKACFLYFGIFNEDELILGKRLELLWVAEGFVSKPMNKSYRSVAKEYLSDLVDRNLVTVIEKTSQGAIKSCRLHDLIHDFCQGKAQEENFLQLTNGDASSNSSNSRIYYRYCVSTTTQKKDLFDNVEVAASVHSLLYRQTSIGSEDATIKFEFFRRNLKLVQVLHLEGTKEVSFSNKFQLVDLVHLRYIFISNTRFAEVPESICNLWNLETFIWINYWNTIKLPKTIWKMKRLRHLEGTHWELDLDDDKHEGGRRLDNVETFSTLIIRDERTLRELLQRLPNVQNLRIRNHLTHPAFPLELNFLIKLESLHLRRLEDVIVIFPSTLKSLSLIYCIQIPLDLIGELPCLEVLKIARWDEERWEVEDNKFPKLKYLRLSDSRLEQWDVLSDSFLHLEQLVLKNCTYLEQIPAYFAELPTLQRIQVDYCCDTVKNSAIEIQKEQVDNGNKVQVDIR